MVVLDNTFGLESKSRRLKLSLHYSYDNRTNRVSEQFLNVNYEQTRNTLDCDQSNYYSRIVFSHIPIEFGQKGISAIRSADPENPTVEPNMKWIGRPLAEMWPFEIFPNVRSLVAGRSLVGPQYILLLTLISYRSSSPR